MRRQQSQPQHLAVMLSSSSSGVTTLPRLFDIFSLAEIDEAVVHPVARERRAAVGAAALRDLILVVREDEVDAAAVDVDGLAQMRADHRRTFDVPAGPAAAPRRVPADHALGDRLPQHEVGGIALERRDLDPGAGDHRLAVAAAQRAIIGIAGDAEQTWPSAS